MTKHFLVAFVVCALAMTATAQLTTITQSTDNTTPVAGSISCNAGGLHADNAYIREYDPIAAGIFTPIFFHGIDVGVEVATGAGGIQPVVVNIYSDPTPGDLTANVADWVLLGSESFLLSDTTLTVQQLRFSAPGFMAYTPSGSDSLIVEFFTPDGQTAGHSFFVGSNAAGQSGPSYLTAAACGATLPSDIAALGFPAMNVILDLVFDPTNQVTATGRPGTGADFALLTGANGVVDNAFDKTASASANDALEIRVFSPLGTFSGEQYLVILQLSASGSPYGDVAGGFGPVFLSADPAVLTGAYGNTPIAPIGAPPLLGAGDTQILVLPTGLAGLEIGVQGLSLAGANAANGVYESTDHHVIGLL